MVSGGHAAAQQFASLELLEEQASAGVKPAELGFAKQSDDSLLVAGRPGLGLAFCAVPKVATTLWKVLLQRLDGNERWHEMAATPHYDIVPKFGHGLGFGLRRVHFDEAVDKSNESALPLLDDPAWTKVTFVRDPLVRLLSGYLDKCTKAPSWERVHSCFGPWIAEKRVPSFKEFTDHLFDSTTNSEEIGLHFRPQAHFCGLDHPGNAAKFVVFADMDDLEEKTIALLEGMGLSHLAQDWPSGSMFHRSNHAAKGHATNAAEKLRKYYTRAMCIQALEFYKDSYAMFQTVDAAPMVDWHNECSELQDDPGHAEEL